MDNFCPRFFVEQPPPFRHPYQQYSIRGSTLSRSVTTLPYMTSSFSVLLSSLVSYLLLSLNAHPF